jgi:hypothetical protein
MTHGQKAHLDDIGALIVDISYLSGLSLQQQLTEAFLHPLFHLRAINENNEQ